MATVVLVVVDESVSSLRPTRKMIVTTRTTNRPVRIQAVRFIRKSYWHSLLNVLRSAPAADTGGTRDGSADRSP